MKTKTCYESMVAAWIGWTKARHGWTASFAREQARLYVCGERGVALHDVTCVTFDKYFLPIYNA